MSYKVYFDLSRGLRTPLHVPTGTLKRIRRHVAKVESTLGYETERYLNNPRYWKTTKPIVSDKVFCEIAEKHNRFVRCLWDDFCKWSSDPEMGEEIISCKAAAKFWHALRFIDVPQERWTADYYRARMESLYEVMRGRESEGVNFDEDPLTERQAAMVILLFSAFLDGHDLRLDVPKDHDRLESSDDGGYVWCDKCGAVDPDDLYDCDDPECPLREEEEEEEY